MSLRLAPTRQDGGVSLEPPLPGMGRQSALE
jgi:hypothetical protein